jgi:hypothetical protein
MIRKVLLSVLVLTSIGCFGQTDTVNYKNNSIGKWKYLNFSPDLIYVVQTLDKHTEFAEKGSCNYEFDVNWINDSEYELIYAGTNCKRAAVSEIGEITKVKIIKIDKDTLFYHTRFRDMEDFGKMIRMKN